MVIYLLAFTAVVAASPVECDLWLPEDTKSAETLCSLVREFAPGGVVPYRRLGCEDGLSWRIHAARI
jgi:hypothetical protein